MYVGILTSTAGEEISKYRGSPQNFKNFAVMFYAAVLAAIGTYFYIAGHPRCKLIIHL